MPCTKHVHILHFEVWGLSLRARIQRHPFLVPGQPFLILRSPSPFPGGALMFYIPIHPRRMLIRNRGIRLQGHGTTMRLGVLQMSVLRINRINSRKNHASCHLEPHFHLHLRHILKPVPHTSLTSASGSSLLCFCSSYKNS